MMMKHFLLPKSQIMSKGLSQIENSLKAVDFAFHFFHIPYSTSKFCWQRWKKGKKRGSERMKSRKRKREQRREKRVRKKKMRELNESSRSFLFPSEVTESFTSDIQLTFIWNWYSWIASMTHRNIKYRYFCVVVTLSFALLGHFHIIVQYAFLTELT